MGIWENISKNIPGWGGSSDALSNGAASSGDANASDPNASDAELSHNGAPHNGTSAENALAGAASGEASEEAQAARTKEGARQVMSTRYTFTTKEEPDADRPFAHGYVDGAESVEKTPFERFVRIQAEVERINEELERLNEREQELKATREERVELEANVERDRVRLEGDERDAAEAEEAYNEAAITHASTQKTERKADAAEETPDASANDTPPKRGSLLYAGLYTLAGFVFVGGEIIMSREVVANGLRLQGQVEPWLFAIGIALLAVLLKPAYDRMVEKPYWNGNKRPFQIVIGLTVVLTLATLVVLGAFRTEAYSTEQQQERLNEQISNLQNEGAPTEEIEPLQQRYDELDTVRFNSRLGLWSFILTGVLFAVAGAISLGIGLNHLRTWFYRRYQGVRGWPGRGVGWISGLWRRRKLNRLRDEQKALRKKRDAQRVQLRGREKALSHMPAMEAIDDQISRVEAHQEELRAARSAAISNRDVEAYSSGYDLAQQSKVSFQATSNSPPSTNGTNGPPNGTSRTSRTDDESSRRRPFLRVRDEISSSTFNNK